MRRGRPLGRRVRSRARRPDHARRRVDAAVASDATSADDATVDPGTTDAAPPDTTAPDVTTPDATPDVPPPLDAAPPDFGGDGGCTFGGTSLAASVGITTVSGASPVGSTVMLAERPGGLVVGWRSSAGWRLTPLDSTGARAGSDLPVDGVQKIFGVAAGADGYAVLASRSPDYMTFLRTNGAGAIVAQHDLVGGGDHTVVGTEWFGEFAETGRLVATSTGFSAYFAIHRRWPDGIGHQGDTLRHFDWAGKPTGAGWSWGCSHSMDQRLEFNGTKLGAMCLSDCYPQKAIMLNHTQTVISDEPSGDCAGYVNASLGDLASDGAGGFFAAVLSKEGRSSRDVKLVHVGASGKVVSTSWLTETPQNESSLHLARFGGGLVAGWVTSGKIQLQRVDDAGSPVGSPEELALPWPEHDFVSLTSGDAAWAAVDSTGLRIVRLRACP